MNRKNYFRKILILALIVVLAAGLYFFGWKIPLINKIPFISKKHDHIYKPVLDEEGKIKYWTCVMHPSLRLSKPGKCPICGMETVPVLAKSASPTGGEKNNKTDGKEEKSYFTVSLRRQQLIGVRTQPVAYRQFDKDIRTVGIVEMDETKIEHIHTKIIGWIDKVYVDYTWQYVKRGDPLFTIYSPELVSTQEEYLLALKSEKLLGNSEFPEISEAGKSLLKASRKRLELWDISDGQITELENTGIVKKSLVIYSPISGHVMKKNAYENQYVKPEEILYVIADHSTVWIQVDIYENDLALIKLGDSATMTFSAYPGEEFTGEVAFISPQLDPKTRTIKVRIEYPNPDLKLLPDMYVNVNIKKAMGKKLTIPESSVLRTGKEDLVFVSKQDGIMQIRKVMLGQKAGGYYEVKRGLKEGERVVSRANFLIDSESQIQGAVATWEDDTNENSHSEMNTNNEIDQNLELYPEAIPKENEEMNHNQHMH